VGEGAGEPGKKSGAREREALVEANSPVSQGFSLLIKRIVNPERNGGREGPYEN